MEPITQALLGSAVAQAGFAKKLGLRALGWGALIGILPDFDILVAPLHGGFGEMVYHRGSTHALWFGPVVGPLLGWLLWRWRDGDPERLRAWIGLAVFVLFTHPLLDVFTTYGTQLLAPFSRHRFAWNGIGIIDPFYTVILATGVWIGCRSLRLRATAAWVALILSSAYLGYGVLMNASTKTAVEAAFAEERQEFRLRVYPTLLQPWLRRFVARGEEEVRVGLHTRLRPERFWWESFPPPEPDPRVDAVMSTWEGRTFHWFAMEEITWRVRVAGGSSTVEIDDLRYGLPGSPPSHGMWGIRAVFDEQNSRTSPVERYARRRGTAPGKVLRALWDGTWGDFREFESSKD